MKRKNVYGIRKCRKCGEPALANPCNIYCIDGKSHDMAQFEVIAGKQEAELEHLR